MPWSVGDVERHRKGLTPSQKKKWVSVANGVLKDCQAKGGSDCEGKAIRIANSKFDGEIKMTKIPYGALRLVELGKDCHAFAEEKDSKVQLNMTVYSGGIIKGHWWWGNLAVDLGGMSFPKSKYPVLENHNTDKKIGFTGKPIVDGSIKLDPKTTQFVSTEESKKFQETSKEGFPYQASMYAVPTSVERVREGEKAEVNGFTMKGPASIWRKAIFQEASVCVFGWDKQTESSAFSKEQMAEIEIEEIGGDVETFTHKSGFDESNIETNKEVKEMPKTVKELQEKYPDLCNQFKQEVTDELSTSHSQELKAKDDEILQLRKENEKQEDRLGQLEKKDAIRTEKELKSDAEKIINDKLSASDLPERLYGKVRGLINHNKFVKDDKLDIEALAAKIDQEIKDFEEAGVTSSVLGLGNNNRQEESPEKLARKKEDEEDNEAVDSMYHMAMGTKPEKKDEK